MWYDCVWVSIRVCEGEGCYGMWGCVWYNGVRAKVCGGCERESGFVV